MPELTGEQLLEQQRTTKKLVEADAEVVLWCHAIVGASGMVQRYNLLDGLADAIIRFKTVAAEVTE